MSKFTSPYIENTRLYLRSCNVLADFDHIGKDVACAIADNRRKKIEQVLDEYDELAGVCDDLKVARSRLSDKVNVKSNTIRWLQDRLSENTTLIKAYDAGILADNEEHTRNMRKIKNLTAMNNKLADDCSVLKLDNANLRHKIKDRSANSDVCYFEDALRLRKKLDSKQAECAKLRHDIVAVRKYYISAIEEAINHLNSKRKGATNRSDKS